MHPVIQKHGIDAILEPFIKDLNTLTTQGINVNIGGYQHNFKGGLLCFLADNLASNLLGGFKESFSFSKRFCRTCMVKTKSYKDNFLSNNFFTKLLKCTRHNVRKWKNLKENLL